MTRRHVAEGVEQLARQRGTIERIKEQRQDPAEAILLLGRLEEIQREHIAHRDRLEAML